MSFFGQNSNRYFALGSVMENKPKSQFYSVLFKRIHPRLLKVFLLLLRICTFWVLSLYLIQIFAQNDEKKVLFNKIHHKTNLMALLLNNFGSRKTTTLRILKFEVLRKFGVHTNYDLEIENGRFGNSIVEQMWRQFCIVFGAQKQYDILEILKFGNLKGPSIKTEFCLQIVENIYTLFTNCTQLARVCLLELSSKFLQ
jgi:hypothetical protein